MFRTAWTSAVNSPGVRATARRDNPMKEKREDFKYKSIWVWRITLLNHFRGSTRCTQQMNSNATALKSISPKYILLRFDVKRLWCQPFLLVSLYCVVGTWVEWKNTLLVLTDEGLRQVNNRMITIYRGEFRLIHFFHVISMAKVSQSPWAALTHTGWGSKSQFLLGVINDCNPYDRLSIKTTGKTILTIT